MSQLPRVAFSLALPVALVPLAAQAVTFRPRVDFGLAQENVQRAVSADFNRDGNSDIAVTLEGYNQGKLQVLFGDGQADFGSSTEVSSYVAWGLGQGDFDADGWLDLAATSYGWAQHGVRVWRNDHNGGFTNISTVSTLATPPVGVTTGDFDGDGHLDLAAISEGGGYAVDWFRGNGAGGFSTFRVVPNTHGLIGRRIYTGHFNADRHLDLVAIHQTGVMVLLNDSAGTGNFNASAGVPLVESMASGAVADLDGDGRDDLVTAGQNLRVWRSLGNGAFALLSMQPTTSGALETLVGDVDNDRTLDIVVIGLGGVQLFFGRGGGAFSAPQNLAAGVYPKSGVLGDWNGDGWADLAVACQNYAGMDSYLSVYEQIPPSIPASATAYGAGCGAPTLGFTAETNGRPIIGQVGRARVVNPPTQIVGVALGVSDRLFGATPLPIDLSAIGMPGCDLWQSMDVPTLPVSPATLVFSAPIPNQPTLIGTHVFLQAYAVAPGQNALQLILSNGIDWSFGNS